ncbi:MAG: hypothetical protein WKG07_14115 [Hymenobacter sp.]
MVELKQLYQHDAALKQRIRESRLPAGQLLQAALREAPAGPGGGRT